MNKENRNHPIRTCIACGEKKCKSDLHRLVIDDRSRVYIDEKKVVQKRAVYICRDLDCLKLAIKRNSFMRAFKQTVNVDQLIELMEREGK